MNTIIKIYYYLHSLIIKVTNIIWCVIIFPYYIYLVFTNWKNHIDEYGRLQPIGLFQDSMDKLKRIFLYKDKVLPIILGIIIIYFLLKTI